MKNIKVYNGVKIILGGDASLVIWEDYDGWNIDINESTPVVRIGRKTQRGVHYSYFNDKDKSPRKSKEG